ncbi:hypothetical protein KEM52_006605 [Ascosphaera acerosa]|nr:hypothetical protein KEM52_006605 [Ascosphaera acerosa]
MPAPLVTGLIIGTSVAVAAAIAAYESPQVRALIRKGRQKLAEWLHALGDEVSPAEKRKILELHDISMTEEKGADAERRRQAAREEIVQRASILERRRGQRAQAGQQAQGGQETQPPSYSSAVQAAEPARNPATSFDGLVDRSGRLVSRTTAAEAEHEGPQAGDARHNAVARSTGVDPAQPDQTPGMQAVAAGAVAVTGIAVAAAIASLAADGREDDATPPAAESDVPDISDPFSDPSDVDGAAVRTQPTLTGPALAPPVEHGLDNLDAADRAGDSSLVGSATASSSPVSIASASPASSASAPTSSPSSSRSPTPSGTPRAALGHADHAVTGDRSQTPSSDDSFTPLPDSAIADDTASRSPSHALGEMEADDDGAGQSSTPCASVVLDNASAATPGAPRSPSMLSRLASEADAHSDVMSMTDTSADMLSDLESMRGGQLTPEWSEVGSVVSTDDSAR